ncbi:uncharacterized protein LOC124327190 isoform X1 [Daphnia pulicaria]|uniref:uncharacterized protein LOC124327190 isoform X1 n=1 Tax=Daphnia pulicaria TaxID=35523 RepID=UPI001EEAE7B6|nr:uncharacterized protein LOC124327190 isoform X1 [Daphnia pulicaria]
MEESNSPVLSCKKFGKKTHVLPESPILSCGRKRKKPLPDDSPVFLRTTRTIKSCNESPVIDSFSSPPPIPKLKPKTLFPEVDDAPPSVESQLSQASSSKCNDHIIDEEDSSSTGSEDDLIVHERTMSDSEDRLDVTIPDNARSQNSISISQTLSYYSGISTPEKKVVKAKPVATGSARKKKQFILNGLAKQLSKLLVRQESDYHLWKFQQKLGSSKTDADPATTTKMLRLRIESLSPGNMHSLAHCRNLAASATTSRGEGSLSNRVSLVFTPERWERFSSVQSGDIVSIYEPWQSMELVGGVTLLLDFNLLLLSQKKKKEVSKLSNSSDSDGLLLGATNDSRTVEDLTDADGRACSSASADSITVAENRRPSTVTVLQTWTCPCQGCTLCHF